MKRKLSKEQKRAILRSEEAKRTGKTIVVKDETNEDGNPVIGRISIDVVCPAPDNTVTRTLKEKISKKK
ncbi:hypothetical protein [Flavisphingomonas formosensis]|uniref:hypothetical protein n=1 Tax=Flavisphingomonas formosensis TaxID=861534 RepID=UPI0012FA7055|nr:hypothetical protein [Sphingomonas formosensis]